MSEPREPVQFCPCGCVAYYTVEQIKQAGGEKQLEDIKAGRKLDAVILPTSRCGSCTFNE